MLQVLITILLHGKVELKICATDIWKNHIDLLDMGLGF